MSINWLNLAPGVEGIALPTYGQYGGPGYTGGETIEPGETPDFTVDPVDSLDALFQTHDLAYSQSDDPLTLARADLALIDGIAALDEDDLSGEGNLYGGVAALTMFYQIVHTHERPEVLAGRDVEDLADDALDRIGEGSIEPDPGEEAGLLVWLTGASAVLGTVDDALVLETAEEVLDVIEDLEVELETAQEALDLLLESAEAALEQAQDAVGDQDIFEELEELINGGVTLAEAGLSNDFLL